MPDTPPPYQEKKDEFSVGQVVWAKLDGFPWWPARIATVAEAPLSVQESLHPKPDHLLVYFFGDHNFAFLRENKIQPFSKNHAERTQQKVKNFKIALQESQQWLINPTPFIPSIPAIPPATSPTTSPIPSPSPSPSPIPRPNSPINTDGTTSPPVSTHTSPTMRTPTHKHSPALSTPSTHKHAPSPLKTDYTHIFTHEPPDQGPVVDIPLSAELAKIWDYVEVDEDTVDGFVVISSEKDMSPVVAYYNEHKRRLAMSAYQIPPKRPKTETSTPNKVHIRTDFPATPSVPNPAYAPPPTARLASPFSTLVQTIAASPSAQNLGQKVPIQRHVFNGAATNGFVAAPLRGVVEGSEDGLHVEFTVQGHTYRGFLLARENFPALVSPLVPPMAPPYPGYSPYANLAKLTAMAVAKQHHDRLADLGRLVVSSAMVPYAYPPPLHL